MNDDTLFTELASRFWHPIARGADVRPGELIGATLLDRKLAVC